MPPGNGADAPTRPSTVPLNCTARVGVAGRMRLSTVKSALPLNVAVVPEFWKLIGVVPPPVSVGDQSITALPVTEIKVVPVPGEIEPLPATTVPVPLNDCARAGLAAPITSAVAMASVELSA